MEQQLYRIEDLENVWDAAKGGEYKVNPLTLKMEYHEKYPKSNDFLKDYKPIESNVPEIQGNDIIIRKDSPLSNVPTQDEWLSKWQTVRTKAISEMFDNVDSTGVYPTSKFFQDIDKWLLKNPYQQDEKNHKGIIEAKDKLEKRIALMPKQQQEWVDIQMENAMLKAENTRLNNLLTLLQKIPE